MDARHGPHRGRVGDLVVSVGGRRRVRAAPPRGVNSSRSRDARRPSANRVGASAGISRKQPLSSGVTSQRTRHRGRGNPRRAAGHELDRARTWSRASVKRASSPSYTSRPPRRARIRRPSCRSPRRRARPGRATDRPSARHRTRRFVRDRGARGPESRAHGAVRSRAVRRRGSSTRMRRQRRSPRTRARRRMESAPGARAARGAPERRRTSPRP